ncbi:MAG: hypothetical protein ABSH34_34315 [Verrucomicrobiota bacterium]|jgi:hypothetical protein
MRRREFLAGAGGFSVVVLAGKLPAMAREELPADEVRRQLERAAPAAARLAAGRPSARRLRPRGPAAQQDDSPGRGLQPAAARPL